MRFYRRARRNYSPKGSRSRAFSRLMCAAKYIRVMFIYARGERPCQARVDEMPAVSGHKKTVSREWAILRVFHNRKKRSEEDGRRAALAAHMSCRKHPTGAGLRRSVRRVVFWRRRRAEMASSISVTEWGVFISSLAPWNPIPCVRVVSKKTSFLEYAHRLVDISRAHHRGCAVCPTRANALPRGSRLFRPSVLDDGRWCPD